MGPHFMSLSCNVQLHLYRFTSHSVSQMVSFFTGSQGIQYNSPFRCAVSVRAPCKQYSFTSGDSCFMRWASSECFLDHRCGVLRCSSWAYDETNFKKSAWMGITMWPKGYGISFVLFLERPFRGSKPFQHGRQNHQGCIHVRVNFLCFPTCFTPS